MKRDKHITYTDLGGGYFRLVPKSGYRLVLSGFGREFSEAVVEEKDIDKFYAVAISKK